MNVPASSSHASPSSSHASPSPSPSSSPSPSPFPSSSAPPSRRPSLARVLQPFAGAAIVIALLALLAGTGRAGKSTTPPELVGSWSWTTISSVGYVDTTTHQLSSPSGMSARFTFTSDGRYTMFFYVRQQTYGMVTESTSTHEGTVVFAADGSFTMKPKKGHYLGHTGSRTIDRAMTAAERKPLTYRWRWRDDDDGRHLYLGPSETALSRFAPGE
jgi:hypothetical protein